MIQLFEFFIKSFSLSLLLLFIAILVSLTHRFKYENLILKFPRLRFSLWMNR